MLTRREFIARGAAGGVVLTVPFAPRALGAQPPLTPYVDKLVIPPVLTPATASSGVPKSYKVAAVAVNQRLHRDLPRKTPMWGYADYRTGTPVGACSPGPTMIGMRGTPVQVTYTNKLPSTPLFGEDDPLILHHIAEAAGVSMSSIPPVRINTHLHGGRISGNADGNPYATKLSGELTPGKSKTVTYLNDQAEALAWYHDHAVGITRRNVYSGLAGGFVIADPESPVTGLPGGEYDVPLIIQDRELEMDALGALTGRLSYPGTMMMPAPGRTWVPEFFGRFAMVNGKIWPYMEVEPRLYRFRLLNGSQSRFYALRLFSTVVGAVPFRMIGTDLGWLSTDDRNPLPVQRILLAPAERADVLVDFSDLAGSRVVLRDNPLPAGTASPAPPMHQDGIVQFRVAGSKRSVSFPTLPSPTKAPTAARKITHTLEEVIDPATAMPKFALLDGKLFHDPLQAKATNAAGATVAGADVVKAGQAVMLELVNLTADTHPIHTHLTDFRVVSRQAIDTKAYQAALDAQRTGWDPVAHTGDTAWMGKLLPNPSSYVKDGSRAADAIENGPKDTVRANPGEVTRIVGTFSLPAGVSAPQKYVWHCHILEHEDNDMMRPIEVRSSI